MNSSHPEYEIRYETPPSGQLRVCVDGGENGWISLTTGATLFPGDIFITLRAHDSLVLPITYHGCSWILSKYGVALAANQAIRMYGKLLEDANR